jgi:hypothetical protein
MVDCVEMLNEAFEGIAGIRTFVGGGKALTLLKAVEDKQKRHTGPRLLELQWLFNSSNFSTTALKVGSVVDHLLADECMLSTPIIDQVVESMKVCCSMT